MLNVFKFETPHCDRKPSPILSYFACSGEYGLEQNHHGNEQVFFETTAASRNNMQSTNRFRSVVKS